MIEIYNSIIIARFLLKRSGTFITMY